MKTAEFDVCIVGGGPAGMLAALLLAKGGKRVLVIEQHHDFAREYRGEVLMPRFTQIMRHVGLFDHLEKYPHRKLPGLEGFYHAKRFIRIGIDKIAPEVPFAVWMPQPVMLAAFQDKAKELSTFNLWFNTGVKELIFENGICKGIIAEKDHEAVEIRAKVIVGADGRFSMIRKLGHFELDQESHKFDLVWFTVPEPENYDHQVQFYLSKSRNYLILPKYPKSLQIGVVVPAGEFTHYRREGIESFKKILLETGQPIIQKFAREVTDFHSFFLLQAKIEHVKEWAKDSLLLIGDAAHTCSPAGAIGVSVAAQTAATAADVIFSCFEKNDFSKSALSKVQQTRDADVLGILKMQETVSGLLFPKSRFFQSWIVPAVLFLIAKLGIFKMFQRRLMVLQSELTISEELIFTEPCPAESGAPNH